MRLLSHAFVSLALGLAATIGLSAVLGGLMVPVALGVFVACSGVLLAILTVARRGREAPLAISTCLGALAIAGLCAVVSTAPADLPGRLMGIGVRPAMTGTSGTLSNVVAIVVGLTMLGAIVRLEHRARTSGVLPERQESTTQRTARLARWASLTALACVIAGFSCIPTLRQGMAHVFELLSSGDVEAVKGLLRSYGPWAAAVSFALMILQSLAAPIPAFLITFANANVFGWWQGALLSWASAMAGAAVCFWIARLMGREAVAHFVTDSALAGVDRFFRRYGDKAILICRLLPFMSFDIVSYAAGLTSMGFGGFLWATGLGQLPATIVYSYVGGMLSGGVRTFMMALCILFALAALVVLLRQLFSRRHGDLMSGVEGDVAAGTPADEPGAPASDAPLSSNDEGRGR